MSDCIFCNIVAGKIPAYQVWEDEHHLAFLTPFPNTEGFTVVIPKEHHPSYFAEATADVRNKLIGASSLVAKRIDASFEDVGRTGLIFEGFGVDHLHVKLFPMHGTVSDEWKERQSHETKYFEQYEGYISSHDAQPADAEKLAEVAKKIREAL